MNLWWSHIGHGVQLARSVMRGGRYSVCGNRIMNCSAERISICNAFVDGCKRCIIKEWAVCLY